MYDILGAIDGTGPSSNADYAVDFKTSNVTKLCGNAGKFSIAGYLRGPSALGLETQGSANSITNWVEQKIKANQKMQAGGTGVAIAQPKVFLTGYSRGGAAVINASHQLKRRGVEVHCLMLFDAVDRSTMGDTDEIPDNVNWAFHAMRDPMAGSREMFGNCGTRIAPGVIHYSKKFYCTHGGMGGTPWDKVGDSGFIEEMTTGEKTGVVAAGTLAGGFYGGYKAKQFADKNDFTKVTMAQEKKGTEEVWAWMQKNLSDIRHYGMSSSINPIRSYGKTFAR